jgi:hypothetical protein
MWVCQGNRKHNKVIKVTRFNGIHPLRQRVWTSTKLTVENFVHKDGEITVHGALTDPELLTLQDKGEEAIEEKPLAPFTLSQT